jgi:hypothetical protein
VEFSPSDRGEGLARAPLTRISVAGFAFEIEGSTHLRPQTTLQGLKLHIGRCVLEGQGVVRSVATVDGGRTEVGCLFHPESSESEDRWTAVVAGIEAVQGI